MNFLICLAAGAVLLSSQPDSTAYIQPYYRNLADKLAIKPAFEPAGGNEFEIIRTGKRYAELLLDDIDSAEKIIELEVFLWGEDPAGLRVRDTLTHKVAQGVPVRYIYDNFGNFFDSAFDGRPVFTGFFKDLRKRGIDVREHTPLWLPDFTYTQPSARNHRKINLIDGKVAYVGGMNLTQGSMSGWGDTQIRITGPAAQKIRAQFLEDWNMLGPENPEYDRPFAESSHTAAYPGGKTVQFVADGPDQPAYMMEETIVWLLEHAKEYVWFETPYFLPSRPVMKAMKKAVERGVDVRVITPEITDMTSFDPAFHSSARECIRSGIKLFYRQPPFNHSKTLVCDDYITCVGSSNLDKLSLLSLYEAGVLIYDTPTASGHKAYLTGALDNSIVVDQKFIDSWDSSERFKQSMLGIIGHWL